MTEQDAGVWGPIILVAIGQLGACIGFLLTQNNSLRKELTAKVDALAEKEALDIGALRNEANQRDESLERELSVMIRDGQASLQSQIEALRRDGATKPELKAVQQRVLENLNEFKAETRSNLADITKKVDRLPLMELQISAIGEAVKQLLNLASPGAIVPPMITSRKSD
jgi:Skp family chaperone for outer membrane proteins